MTPDLLDRLESRYPVCIIGAAVVDVIADAYTLPHRGSDVELHQQDVAVGGCALNVAIALRRLNIRATNALPMGNGVWAGIIRQKLRQYDIHSVTETASGDNGWCLALVEPDGERTFLSVSGVENQWDDAMLQTIPQQPGGWFYLSGYQLTSASGEKLLRWFENLGAMQRLLIDFGPRLAELDAGFFTRVMALKPLVTVNRQEAEMLWYERLEQQDNFDVQSLLKQWVSRYGSPLIVRLDSEGAGFNDGRQQKWLAPLPAKVVDTIGAGDSHAGGLLAGLAAGWPLEDAIALGNAVASFVVSHRGGDCSPDRESLRKYWQQSLTPQ